MAWRLTILSDMLLIFMDGCVRSGSGQNLMRDVGLVWVVNDLEGG